jgi:hypothetical protein
MWGDLMKQPVNFRLNQRSMAVLESLVQSLGISKTQVVEEALDQYVHPDEEHKHPLLAFSGILNDKEAESMLQAIADRHNKDSDFTL